MNNQKTLIICQSIHHGNTMKVAMAMGQVLNATVISPKEFDESSLSEYTLIGFGSGIYNQKHHESLFNLVEQLDNQNNKKAFIFSTATIPFKTVNEDLKQRLIEKDFDVIGEFSCKGFMDYSFTKKMFGGLNKGRPKGKDLKNAEEFAKELRGR